MKDIKKKEEEKHVDWLGRLETAGELVSGGLFMKNLISTPAAPMPIMQPYVGPAVGIPINGAVARQAFQGLADAAIPIIGGEELAIGAAAAVGEAATGGMLLPGLAIGGAALAAGSGLYHYAKKYLDEDPNDRRGKIIMDNLDAKDKRAKNLISQAFDDDTDDGSYAQAFGV